MGRLLSGPSRSGYLRKWIIFGALIGVIAGLGAVVFFTALQASTHWVLGTIGGYHVATIAGEGGVHAASRFARPWAVPLVVGGGALLAAILVFAVAPEAEGHGTDAAIAAVHANPKGLRPRVALVKIVASALTIGSGGSGGREGPTAQISATFGSMLARALNLTPADSRIAVASGIASGIGAIFRAPLGGAVLGAELVYRDDVEVDALIPSIVASVVAFGVYGAVTGNFNPIFGDQTGYHLSGVRDLALFAVVGMACGLLGRLYARTFYAISRAATRLALPRWVKPGLAGLAVGGLGLAVPGVLGTGYGQLQQELSRQVLLGLPLWVVLVLPFAKIVATSLSIGSGGSGGIFGPGMVIGGATGAAVWRLLETAHLALGGGPLPFVIVGMTACFGAVAHAPLAVMLMVAEMTGSLQLLAPAMVAIAVAVLVVGDVTIYRSQLASRADSPAHRLSAGLPPAATVAIRDIMAEPRLVLRAATLAAEARANLRDLELPGAPVVDRDGVFIGSLQTPRLDQLLEDGSDGPIGRLADVEAMTVPDDATLDAAVDAVASSRGGWIPVLDVDMRVVGIVSTTDLVRGWRLATRTAMRRLGSTSRETVLLEETVAVEAAADGARVDQMRWPRGAVLVAVHRRNGLAYPHPDTELRAGDTVSVLTRRGDEAAVHAMFDRPAQATDHAVLPSATTVA
ncbi:MAG TPA: chloride channel protein [Mycobacteriales bacterium]|nr:chloride channel protein [Mycobacteriales bacterium]